MESTALAPDVFELVGGLRGLLVHRFQQPAASRAIVEDFGDGKARAAPLFETSKFRRHEPFIIKGMLAVHLENGAVSVREACPCPRGRRASRCFVC